MFVWSEPKLQSACQTYDTQQLCDPISHAFLISHEAINPGLKLFRPHEGD
jgi:hypothetical protein